MHRLTSIVIILIFTVIASCNKKPNNDNTLFSNLPSDKTNIFFQNTVKNTPDFNIFSYRNFYNGGGVAIGDLNNDGLQDIYFTSNMGENKLYINEGNLKFKDITQTAGVADSNKWSTGVALVDINSDGWLDIYVCNAGYRSQGNTKNTLYINNHDLTFTEKAEEYGLDEDGYTTHAAFFDFDMDGDLDVYILNNSFIPVNTLNYSNARNLRAKDWNVKDFLKGGGDKLLRNDNGKYTDVSERAGIYGSLIGFGLGVTVGDVDNDGWPDIYVSNDFFERDYLYINQKNGTFKEELEIRISHLSTSSMGADMADLNNDGCPEIFVTDMLPYNEYRLKTTTTFDNINVHDLKVKNGFYNQYLQNSLQVNNGSGQFDETAFFSGVAGSDWSWGALLFDADQDLMTDIFVCNGIYHDVIDQDFIDFFANDVIQKMALNGKKEQLDSIINKMPSTPIQNMAFRNNGRMKFSNVSNEWGLSEKTFSNGAAYGDLDNDGDLDLVINNVNQPALLYKNNAREIHKNDFIGLQLIGDEKNPFAIGSSCKVYINDTILSQQLIPNKGFQSSVDLRLVFGLGKNSKIDSVIINWPDTKRSKILNLPINQYHKISKLSDHSTANINKNVEKKLFVQSNEDFPKHIENNHVDFYFERNIPMMLSKEGPKIAMGDVNNDGKNDLYFCGAAGQAGALYIGLKKGFKFTKQTIFNEFKEWEDTEAVFFDVDGDKDLDLFVGSGGNSMQIGSRELQDRIYINDGSGNFSIDTRALPPNGYNTSVAIPFDFDNDGDLDIFVGSRSYPGEYGMSPRSYIYQNNGKGSFVDILAQIKELSNPGMVTDAAWGDIDGDKKNELIIVGEWMAPLILNYVNNRWVKKEVDPSFNNLNGFWQSVHLSDFDKDGRIDILLGNSGNNGYLQDERYLPLTLYINDFDNNGMPEKLMSRQVEGKDMPISTKRDMVEQLSILKKKNLKHKEYADKSIQELFGDQLKKATHKTITTTKSYIAYNKGSKGFLLKELCEQAQWSSINDVLMEDINEDNYIDLIIVGNLNGFQPQFGALDANKGLVLLNNKKGDFIPAASTNTGLNIKGKSRQIIKTNGLYIVARNDDFPYIFERLK